MCNEAIASGTLSGGKSVTKEPTVARSESY